MSLRNALLERVEEVFSVTPEYLFEKTPLTAVFRHLSHKKWFGIVMTVAPRVLGLSGEKPVDILNVKLDPLAVGGLLGQKGFLPAYHMNKTHWITVLLDGSVPLSEIETLLSISFDLTK